MTTRIAQVVANLLNNAAKYTPPGGRIALSARVEGEQVAITVSDNGVGIPADELASVFEMFKQPTSWRPCRNCWPAAPVTHGPRARGAADYFRKTPCAGPKEYAMIRPLQDVVTNV